MFFGVPNRGTERADTASSILKVLNTVFSVNRNVVRDLEYKSQRLANISMEFRTIRHTHSIPVISFFETVRYNYALGLVSLPLLKIIMRTFPLCCLCCLMGSADRPDC